MESRNKLEMCRLCLCENECFFNIFVPNEWQGYIAAEVISDVLQSKVSETDCYPHVVCSTCLTKLTDFKLFKKCCQKSKVVYDDMFPSSETLVKHHSEEEASLAGSGVELCEEGPLKDTSIHESGHNGSESELGEQDPLEDTSSDESGHYGSDLELGELDPLKDAIYDIDVKPFKLEPNDEDIDSTEVKLTLLETHPKYQQCLEYKRSQCTSKGETDADLSSLSFGTNDKSKTNSLSEDVASSSRTIEGLEGQSISPGESMYMAPFLQQDINTEKEVEKESGRMEEDIGKGVGQRTSTEKGVRERRKGLECFHCGIVFMSKHILIHHMKVHGFVNSYDCTICGKLFDFNYELESHFLTHTGSKIHTRSHTDPKPYKCAECSKCFSRKDRLNGHMRTHMGSKPYKCAECSKCFSELKALKRCRKLHTDPKPYKCSECSKCFSRNDHLIGHMRTHTGSKPYKCTECSKCFTELGVLKRHMRIHTGSKPYKCAECNKYFRANSYLKVHMRSHTGYKPYKCTECSKCFRRNGHLIEHMRSHTGYKPYKCLECSKCFTQNSHLRAHMSTHTGYKPYKCAECCKCFSLNCHLKVHMRSHTGSKPYKCAQCSKSFARNEGLTRHMKSHTSF